MNIKAIFFDFDGVLADTEGLHFVLFNQSLKKRGFHLSREEYHRKYIGFNDHEFFVNFFRDHHAKKDLYSPQSLQTLIQQKTQAFKQAIQKKDVFFPGAVKTIQDLGQIFSLAIVSGALGAEIDLILQSRKLLPLFPIIVSAEDCPKGKPLPDPYLMALKMMNKENLSAANCLVVEDTVFGIRSGRAAGMKTVAILGTQPREELAQADFILEKIKELTNERIKTW